MSGGHDAIVEDATGPAFTGAIGTTRVERYQVLSDEGRQASYPLYRIVNTATDPELGERARSGTLHTLPDGRALSLYFVYHDPEARRFALVVPPELAHEALAARAWLLSELAAEHGQAIPEYVMKGPTVVGTEGLSDFLVPPPEVEGDELREADAEDLDVRSRQLDAREQDLSLQERGLIEIAEQLTSRESALQRARSELDEEVAAHEAREEALLSELAELRHRAQVVPAEGPAAEWQEVGALHEVEAEDATVITGVSRMPGGGSDATVITDASAQIATSERPRPPPLRRGGNEGAAHGTPPPLHLRHRSGTPPPLRTSGSAPTREMTFPPPLPGQGAAAVSESEAPPPVEMPQRAPRRSRNTRSAEVDPPAGFASLPRGRMALRTAHEELWLFAHVTQPQAEAFLRASDLLLQCVSRSGRPVVLLTLVAGNDGDQHVLRLPLDGHDPAQVAVVDSLSQSFRVRVALYDGPEYIATLTVATLREGVARSVLDHLEEMPRDDVEIESQEAMDLVLESPPPIDDEDLPFGPARRKANSTVTVRAAVEQLASWMRPEKLREATLIYSVPMHVVEGSARRVLRAAKMFGVALPQGLVEVAVEYNVVQDAQSLVREQIEAFFARLQEGDHLGEAGTQRNWDALFAQADMVGTPVDEALRERAEASLGQLAAAEPDEEEPTGEEELVTELPPQLAEPVVEQAQAYADELPSDAPPMPTGEVKALLSDPRRRVWAIGELGQRGVPSLLEPVFDTIETLPPAELPAAMAAAMAFGEQAADRLQRGLEADATALRHASALALGTLRLRRTLAPLLQRLDVEPTNIWVEIARAIGGFGSGALRSVVRSLPTAAHPERLMVVLAHLANHGASKDVEKLENSDDSQVGEAARKAMARRSRLEWEDLAIREQRTLTDNHPAARFSQSFFAALRKLDN